MKSPLNYTGGKYDLLSQIIPAFPADIDTFYDAFCGGLNVGVNAPARRLFAVDKQPQVIGVLTWIKETSHEDAIRTMAEIVATYGLGQEERRSQNDDATIQVNSDPRNISLFSEESNATADSPSGKAQKSTAFLAYQRAFHDLRDKYNEDISSGSNEIDGFDPRAILYALIVHGFNSFVRFGPNGYSVPYGDRTFNASTERNLIDFCNRLQLLDAHLVADDYKDALEREPPTSRDYVYFDPPYLITLATYNSMWGESDERRLLEFASQLDRNGVRFGISNVMRHAGRTNEILLAWSNDYRVIPIQKRYDSASYNLKDGRKDHPTEEVLVTNVRS